MDYAIVTVPAAPMRKKPNHRQEMSNQLLFGEKLRVLREKKDNWVKVESLYDAYQGWVTRHLITAVDEDMALREDQHLAPEFLNMIEFLGLPMHIPKGSTLYYYDHQAPASRAYSYHYTGPGLHPQTIVDKRLSLIREAHLWLNAPYQWGGKTILGVDCSGFSQTIYKLSGIPIARDARLQAAQGSEVPDLGAALPGDLAFFDDKDEIVHVGILLSPAQIIHAAGKVRIDPIDATGIIHAESGQRTHRLKLIRRFLP
ncbi:C40 family peptidase [Niabella terrae]